jgi:hypothetical protein
MYGAVIAPVNSVLEICGKPELNLFRPDENATGLKACAREIGAVAGTVFDFIALRRCFGAVAGAALTEKASLSAVDNAGKNILAKNLGLTAATGFAQGYALTEVRHGNSGLLSGDRLTHGIVLAAVLPLSHLSHLNGPVGAGLPGIE